MELLKLTSAVIAANLFTVLFLWGLYSASRKKNDTDTSWAALIAIIVPLGMMGIGGLLGLSGK